MLPAKHSGHRDYFVRCLSVRVSVCLSGSHTFLVVTNSYVLLATHALLRMLPLRFWHRNLLFCYIVETQYSSHEPITTFELPNFGFSYLHVHTFVLIRPPNTTTISPNPIEKWPVCLSIYTWWKSMLPHESNLYMLILIMQHCILWNNTVNIV